MLLSAGGLKGGWVRIAYVYNGVCPKGWTSIKIPGTSIPGCRPSSSYGGCCSVFYSTNACSSGYGHVTGSVVAYQKGTTNAFANIASKRKYGDRWIDGPYLDGVSITHGDPSKGQERKHLFSYAVGFSDNYNSPKYNCPCAQYPGPAPPSFVRNDYYCDAGTSGCPSASTYYYKYPVFKNMQCRYGNNCCAQVESPWFYKFIPGYTIRDVIEVRICGDQSWSNEGTIVSQMSLYIQ